MRIYTITLFIACTYAFEGAAQAPTNGLVAYWPFNGNVTDNGPYAIATTNMGVVPTTNNAGVANSAMYFGNNMNTYTSSIYATAAINSNINFSTAQNFTLCHAFRIDSFPTMGGGSGLFDNGVNHTGYATWARRLILPGGLGYNQLVFVFGSQAIITPSSFSFELNTWYHLLAMKNGNKLSFYINGKLITETLFVSFSATAYSQQPKFGTLWYNNASYFNYAPLKGGLDELRIYNRALTDAEIQEVHKAAFACNTPIMSFSGSLNNCLGDSIVFSTNTNASKIWYRNGDPIPNASGYRYVAYQPGIYNCAPAVCSTDVGNTYTLNFNENVWTGDNNENWNDPGNWSCGKIPHTNMDIVLPANAIVHPTIPVGFTAYVKSLTILPGTILTVYGTLNARKKIDVQGKLEPANGGKINVLQ